MSEDDFRTQILSRLDEHGNEIRALRNLIERLVRIEERQHAHTEAFTRLCRRIDSLEAKTQAMESASHCYTTSVRWLERTLWGVVAAGAWYVGALLTHGL